MSRLRFLILFAGTNTVLIVSVSAVSAGGSLALLLGVPSAVLAVAGVALLGRIVALSTPTAPRVARSEVERLKKELR